jgi:hypothetical protein
MCEYSGRLIAWLDQELPDDEATNVEWHVGQCAECRRAVGAYQEVSGVFLACYEGMMAIPPRRRTPFWVGAVASAAAIVAVIFFPQPPPAEKLFLHPPAPPAPSVAASAPVRVQHHAVSAPRHLQWIAAEPTIEVALPADALFPPGAVPEGFSFIADVRFQQ